MTKNPQRGNGSQQRKAKNTTNSSTVSKMPKATTEQLNLAKLLNIPADDEAYQFKLQQVSQNRCIIKTSGSRMH